MRLLGERADRSKLVTLHDGVTVGHVPNSERVGVEVLPVGRQAGEPHGADAERPSRDAAHRPEDRAPTPRRCGDDGPHGAHHACDRRGPHLHGPVHGAVGGADAQATGGFPFEPDRYKAATLDAVAEVTGAGVNPSPTDDAVHRRKPSTWPDRKGKPMTPYPETRSQSPSGSSGFSSR
jgi:hypothetical protein